MDYLHFFDTQEFYLEALIIITDNAKNTTRLQNVGEIIIQIFRVLVDFQKTVSATCQYIRIF